MQNVVVWNSLGFEDIARSHYLLLARLGRGGRGDSKDFRLVTVLQGGVPKAINARLQILRFGSRSCC